MAEEFVVCCNGGSFQQCSNFTQAVNKARGLIKYHGRGKNVRILHTICQEGQGPLSDLQVFLANQKLKG